MSSNKKATRGNRPVKKPAKRSPRDESGAKQTAGATLQRALRVLIPLGLVVLNLVVFAPVRHFEFVNWDDPQFITENPHVLAGLSWANLEWASTAIVVANWHPLTVISHMLDVQWFGLDAGLHHLTNLVLHIATTVLLFELLRSMTGAIGRSAFVAAMFAIHPVHVESVAWVAERKDVLSTFFWALTLWMYLLFVRRRSWSRYLGIVVLFALALLSKPMVVTLPVVLLLLDIWPLDRMRSSGGDLQTWTRLLVEKSPLFAMSLAMGIVTIVTQARAGAAPGVAVLSVPARLSHALLGYVSYIAETFWPFHLAAYYPPLPTSLWLASAAALVLAFATALAFIVRRRWPFVFVGWLWFLVTLAPAIGLVQSGNQGMADRYLYVPMIGLLIAIAWWVPDVVIRQSPRRTLVVAAAAVILVVGCANLAAAQVLYWHDSVSLWRHSVSVVPHPMAYNSLGAALRDQGNIGEAKTNLSRALELTDPNDALELAVIHNNLGLLFTKEGGAGPALAEFEAAVRLNPRFAEAQSNLATALSAEGRFDDAVKHHLIAIQLEPDSAEAHLGLGGALLSEGKADEALPHYAEAVRLKPGMPEAHNGLGAALAMLGRNAEALPQYEEALRLQPTLASAHANLAALRLQQGNRAEAIDELARAVEIDPAQTSWRYNLAALLVEQHRVSEARQHLEVLLSLDPGFQPAQRLLASLPK